MIKKDVIISLKSIQNNGEEVQETEIISTGEYVICENGFILSYDESEATGYKGAKTSLIITGDRKVVMERKGVADSQLIIEKDKKHHCHYGTPYGDFMVGINASGISVNLGEDGGDLNFKYVIDINSSFISDIEIKINVKLNND